MTQATITSPATTSTPGTCPAWCDSGPHADGSPHLGGLFGIDLSLAEPLCSDGVPVTDWLTVGLWQDNGQGSPVIGLMHADQELADLTLAEAEALGRALLELASQARTAA